MFSTRSGRGWHVPHRLGDVLTCTGRDEILELLVFVQDSQPAVPGIHGGRGGLHNIFQHGPEIQISAERQHCFQQAQSTPLIRQLQKLTHDLHVRREAWT